MSMSPPPEHRDSLSEHRLSLSRELLDDIELGRLKPETLVMKAMRLARLMGADEIEEWLGFELKGYPRELSASAAVQAEKSGRGPDENGNYYFWPFAGLIGSVRTMELELSSLQVPSVTYSPSSSNEYEHVGMKLEAAIAPVNTALHRRANLSNQITETQNVVSKITARLHDFASTSYYELAFRHLAEGIFEHHRREVDALLAATAGEALKKIPAIADRLGAGDPEAVSQALTTCRRVLAAFADAIQPPSKPLQVGKETWDAGPDKYMNRLRYYVLANGKSKGRRERLIETLNGLNDRFNAGTHADVSVDEARALFVNLYVSLGEVLSCGT
jgi:hypothetical protein